MPDLVIRDVPQKVIDELEKRAQREGRTLEQEIKFHLQRVADLSRLDNKMDT